MNVIAQGKAPEAPKDPNWPSFFYPPGGAPADGKVFGSAEDVPAGWLDAPSVSAPPPPPPVVKAVKRTDPQEDSRWRREAVENAQRLVATESARDTLVARVRELEGFLSNLRSDAHCPAELAKALDNLGIAPRVGDASVDIEDESIVPVDDEPAAPKRKPRKPAE